MVRSRGGDRIERIHRSTIKTIFALSQQAEKYRAAQKVSHSAVFDQEIPALQNSEKCGEVNTKV